MLTNKRLFIYLFIYLTEKHSHGLLIYLLTRSLPHLIVAAHRGLEGEEEDLQVALLHELGRLLHVPVGVELAQLLLYPAQRVGELAVRQCADHLGILGQQLRDLIAKRTRAPVTLQKIY